MSSSFPGCRCSACQVLEPMERFANTAPTSAQLFDAEVEAAIPSTVSVLIATDLVMPRWAKIEQIASESPGSGEGTKAMRAIVSLADKYAIELELVVEGDQEDGDAARLRKWYRRFGFKTILIEDDEVLMKREPRASCPDCGGLR